MTTDLNWFKSSYSGSEGECVEIAVTPAMPPVIHIRDSKTPTAPTLKVAPTAWAVFLTAVSPD